METIIKKGITIKQVIEYAFGFLSLNQKVMYQLIGYRDSGNEDEYENQLDKFIQSFLQNRFNIDPYCVDEELIEDIVFEFENLLKAIVIS